MVLSRWSRRSVSEALFAGGLAIPLKGAFAAGVAVPVLRVKGNALVYGGAPIRLRGVVIGDLLKPARPPVDYGALIRDWHANVVRLSIHPGYWKADVEIAKKKILASVLAARRAGMFVIVCWHAIGTPNGLQRRPREAWKSREDSFDVSFGLAQGFWRWAAATFATDGAVVFELWNEPVGDVQHPELTSLQWPAFRASWRDLLRIIRRSSSNVVLCTGGRWAYDLRGIKADLVDDDQVAYSWHVYPGKDGGDASKWREKLDGLDQIKPVVVTEWGFCEDCDPRFHAAPAGFGVKFMDELVEPRGLHWTAYNYGARGQPNMLKDDWHTPTKWGVYVRGRLLAQSQKFAWIPNF